MHDRIASTLASVVLAITLLAAPAMARDQDDPRSTEPDTRTMQPQAAPPDALAPGPGDYISALIEQLREVQNRDAQDQSALIAAHAQINAAKAKIAALQKEIANLRTNGVGPSEIPKTPKQ